jgi:ATP phosphoribosyltransferase
MQTNLVIALSKGRIFKETVPLLEKSGVIPKDDPESSRKLILDTNQSHIKLLIVRATDVPTYVQYGAADLGVAGKDVLIEHGGNGLYEPLDLQIAKCKMMVAGRAEELQAQMGENTAADPSSARLRIATKYVNATQRYYAAKGQQVEVIKLYGSMELAPLVGLADRIVDLVDTGNTLKANGLAPLEHITDISSRLIVNKAAMKMKHGAVKRIMDAMEQAVNERAAG